MYHFEDFHTGDTFELGPLAVTEEEIIAFANQFDPQYFHNDPQRAKGSIFGGLVASGWHIGSLYMRMFFDGVLSKTDSIGSPGIDQVRWLLPVRPNDTLHGRFTILDARASDSRSTMGILRSNCELFNQHNQLIMTFTGIHFVGRQSATI